MSNKRSCKKYEAMIEDYIDGLLCEKEQKELEAHVAECDECRASLRFTLALIGMTHASAEELPRGLHDKIIAKTQSDKNRKQLLRRAVLFAACAVIFVSSVAAWAMLPGRQNSGELPPDNIGVENSLSEQTVSSLNDANSLGNAEVQAPEDVATDAQPETMEAEEVPEIDSDVKYDEENVMPEDVTQSAEEATQAEVVMPSPENVATDAPPAEEATESEPHNTLPIASESQSKATPGGEDITLALLIVSGLLAIASFIAFLISLSSVRQITSKKDKE